MSQTFKIRNVTKVTTLLITIALTGCVLHSSTQPQTKPSSKAMADEAARLDRDVNTLYNKAKTQEAIPLAEQSLKLREQALGAHHPKIAISLRNLARIYQAQGEYTRAAPFYLRALTIRKTALGLMHPDVAQSLNDLAVIYYFQGAYKQAEPLLVQALDIREKVLGKTHPDVAQGLNDLALVYQAQGAYARAEPLLVRALDIRANALGPLHPDVAQSLDNLALVYQAQGAYARAEPLYVRALDIQEKGLGPMHLDVAQSLNDLAMLYQAQGTYARAEPLLLRALDIRQKALEPVHPDIAQSLSNLAYLYQTQGAYVRAEPFYVRALEIRKRALGPMHPDIAQSLNNLASLYYRQGAYAQAEPLYVQALAIREKTLGAMHTDVATSLNNLAMLYQTQGVYARAEPLLHRALNIWEQALGEMHPRIATCLNNLAMIYHAQGAYTRAEPLLRQALAIWEKALGELHPNVIISLNNLAFIYQAQGAYARAEPLLARAAELRETFLRTELAHLPETRKRDLMMSLQDETQRLISLHAQAMPASPQALELALTTVLRRKGLVLESLIDTQAILRSHLTPQLRDKLAQLANVNALLSTRLHAPFDPRTAEDQKSEIASLHAQIDNLEAELNKASVEFRMQSEPVTIAKIQAALPRGSALVEFVRYRRLDARQPQIQNQWQEERYLAYLLLGHDPPQWIELGDASRIDAAINAVLSGMRRDANASVAKTALRDLDALVFAPIHNRLVDVSHVIISPDGRLNLVPFEALIDPSGHFELERWLISYVTSGRDLLRFGARQAPRSSAMIIADPDYGPPGHSYVRIDGTLADPYSRLAGTLLEAKEIEQYFSNSKTLAAGQATKEALISLVGPSVLHIATHGFYTHAAAAPPSTEASTSPLYERGMSVTGRTPLISSQAEDPADALDHAGLALAGANIGPEGIVSARELAGRDWWGTQLVVLSACGSGVGAVLSGEGVYGVRRALVLAGAQSQVVSLWNVNDSSTPSLMREFYAELARGTGRAEALRRAKRHMLQQPRFAHPYYWAAFIHAGDWAPLDKRTMRPIRSAPTP